MIIGVPKEIKTQEYRVALLPSAAYQLIKRGHQVVVERGAGTGADGQERQRDQSDDRGRSHGVARYQTAGARPAWKSLATPLDH